MSNSLWRILIGTVIAAHGVGHLFFLVPTLGLAQWGLTGRSWLLNGHILELAGKVVGGALWLVVVAGFVAAGIGMLSQQEWWRAVAIGSAVVSLLGLALFWQPVRPVYSAGLMDIAILVALLLVHWLSVSLVES